MRIKYLLFGICAVACVAVACDDDEDRRPNHGMGAGGEAGEPGSSGKAGTGATSGSSNAGNPGTGGAPGPGEGGSGGETPAGFTEFVHDLVQNHTNDRDAPSSVNDKQFPDPTDDHGHYLVPDNAFDDLF